jgi:hypothetical protein
LGEGGFFVRDRSILGASLIHAGSFSMNVFVTGAAGFIGGSIATGLVRPGIGSPVWCAAPNKRMN